MKSFALTSIIVIVLNSKPRCSRSSLCHFSWSIRFLFFFNVISPFSSIILLKHGWDVSPYFCVRYWIGSAGAQVLEKAKIRINMSPFINVFHFLRCRDYTNPYLPVNPTAFEGTVQVIPGWPIYFCALLYSFYLTLWIWSFYHFLL